MVKPIIVELIQKTINEVAKKNNIPAPNIRDIISSPQVQEVARVAEKEIETMPDEKPQYKSKIIITQIVALAASLLVVYGIDVNTEAQASIVVIIQGFAVALTYVWRMWFTRAELK